MLLVLLVFLLVLLLLLLLLLLLVWVLLLLVLVLVLPGVKVTWEGSRVEQLSQHIHIRFASNQKSAAVSEWL